MEIKNKILKSFFPVAFMATAIFSAGGIVSSAVAAEKIDVSAYISNAKNEEIPNGEYEIRFALYSADRTDQNSSDSAGKIWEETQRIFIQDGILKSYLGESNALPEDFSFSNGTYFLGIKIGEDSEMIPRKRIGAVPLAVNSQFLDGAGIGTEEGNIIVLGPDGLIDPGHLDLGEYLEIGGGTMSGEVEFDSTQTFGGATLSELGYLQGLKSSVQDQLDSKALVSHSHDLSELSFGLLGIDDGGTGIDAYSIGDILYYSSGNSLTALAAGSNGQVLAISGGVPTWSSTTGAVESDPIFSASDAFGVNSSDISDWNSAFGWGDHSSAGYLTAFLETDPTYVASDAAGITAQNIADWSSAFGWGNHSSQNYFDLDGGALGIAEGGTGASTTFSQGSLVFAGADGVYAQDGANIFWNDTTDRLGVGTNNPQERLDVSGNMRISGNIAPVNATQSIGTGTNRFNYGYFENLDVTNMSVGGVDISGSTSNVFTINSNNSSADTEDSFIAFERGSVSPDAALQWDSAVDIFRFNFPLDVVGGISATGGSSSDWNDAFGWGDHSLAGYLTNYTETDSIFGASSAAGIAGTDISNWDSAFGWGDHSSVGYLTSYTETDSIFSASDAAGIVSTDITNWNTSYGWGDHSTQGYITDSSTDTLTNKTWNGEDIDISDYTNLAVSGNLLQLSADTLSIKEGTLTDNRICAYSTTSGLVCDTLPGAIGASYTAGTGLDLTGTEFSLESSVIVESDNISLLNNDSGYITDSSTDTLTNKTWNGSLIGVGYGGTGTSTAFTQGSLVFAGASGIYSQDNANLFWNDTTKSLGIGTTTPSAKLEVVGDIVSKGTAWTAHSAAGDDDIWYSVTYGNGLFVAVSASGDPVMTSPDGVNWTARSAAGNDDIWYSVTYGNGLFVAVSASGDPVMTSPDGVNWTARSAAGNDDTWYNVTYGNGLFVAVGGGVDRVMTSPDGINWTARSAAGNNDTWTSVTYGNGLFVAVSISGDRVMTSPDGINWTARSAVGNNDSWRTVIYGNGLFVAAGNNGDRVMTSLDGINWTARSAAGNDDSWGSVTYSNGLFVAVGAGGDRVMTSGKPETTALATNNTYQGGMNIFGDVGIGTSSPTTALEVNGVITATDGTSSNWNTSYGWGDHSTQGYITNSSTNTLTNKTWNGSLIGVGYGGTGTTTQFTEGSLVFAGANGVYSEDNANLSWNVADSYLRLGSAFSLGVDATDGNKFKIYPGDGIAGTDVFSIDTDGVTTIGSLNMGALSFAENSGIISWVDMSVTSGAASGTVESYMAQLDGNPMLSIYGKSDGSGGTTNRAVGIGTSSPMAMLHVAGVAGQVGFELNSNETTVTNNILMLRSDFVAADDAVFRVQADGTVFADRAYIGTGADYAEFFLTKDTSLSPGDAVCMDVVNGNSVKKCDRDGDDNIVGIVSTNPSVIGNASSADISQSSQNVQRVIVGLIGQVPAKASASTSVINIGDSLTADARPGFLRKALPGESTVGVALEKMESGEGEIKVLISRRNKSMTVEMVEQEVVDRISAMEIEDGVKLALEKQLVSLDQQFIAIQSALNEQVLKTSTVEGMMEELRRQMELIAEQNSAVIDFASALNIGSLIYKDVFGTLDLLEGKLIAKEVETGILTISVIDPQARTIGKAVIAKIGSDQDGDGKDDATGADGTWVAVETEAVTDESKIFISFENNPGGYSWVEKEKGAEGYVGFKIKLSSPVAQDIEVSWWIVEEKNSPPTQND